MTKGNDVNHVITALLENRRGVLARVVDLISGRGFNILSLNVAPTHDNTLSRMTMTIKGDDHVLEQVTKQLNKLVDVVDVSDLSQKRHISAELLLIEVSATPSERAEMAKLAELHNATVVCVHPNSMTIQMAGELDKVEDFLNLLQEGQIYELIRTGVIISPRDGTVSSEQ